MALKYDWKYAEAENGMKYYEANVGKDQLWVFRSIHSDDPEIWLGMYEKGGSKVVLADKKCLERERRKRGLPTGCGFDQLGFWADLCSPDPEYMKAKVEWCYQHGIRETN